MQQPGICPRSLSNGTTACVGALRPFQQPSAPSMAAIDGALFVSCGDFESTKAGTSDVP